MDTVLSIYHLKYNSVCCILYSVYLPKTKNFDCVDRGKPDFPFLFKSCEIDRSQGRLV